MNLNDNLDHFFRRHPRWFVLLLLLLTIIVVVVLLGQVSGTDILYKTF